MYCIYILYSEKLDRYYTGSTGNLDDRLRRHDAGSSLATKAGVPWQLVYTEDFETKLEAVRRELYIKRMKSRKFIKALIEKGD